VALVTTGPGAANTLAATGEAWASESPVVVLATDIPDQLRRPGTYRGVLHEGRDQAGMFAPVVKRAMTADDPRSVAADVQAAAELALAPPTGPVYVGIPTDFLPAGAPSANGLGSDAQPGLPGEPLIEAAVDLLADARAPLICAGGGALEAGAGPAVAALAERLAAPVVMTYAAKGLLPPGHPCAVPATLHAPEVGALWDDADLVIAIGTDFDGLTTQNWAMPNPARLLVINVDEQDGAKNYAPDLTLVGDAAKVTALLSERIPGPSDLEPIRKRLERVRGALRDGSPPTSPTPCRSSMRWRSSFPTARTWSRTCAFPGTGSPAFTSWPDRGRSHIRCGARSDSRCRPRSAPQPAAIGRSASAVTAASCSPAASSQPWRRSSFR
jgi:thiamine pyrophosphate-dependent acetolactate synthase large subunit-like protein